MTGAARRTSIALGFLMALAAVAGGERTAVAQSTAAPAAAAKKVGPGLVIAETTSITAKVDAVDVGKRLVTVTGPRGKTVTLKAGPEVKNLDQIKPGDELIVRYFESVGLFIRKSDTPPAATETAAVRVAPKGKKPVAVVVDTVEFTGTVEAVDHAKRRVTIKSPEGKTRTMKVDPSVTRLDEVKKGDQVVLRYTEAVAFSVRKP